MSKSKSGSKSNFPNKPSKKLNHPSGKGRENNPSKK